MLLALVSQNYASYYRIGTWNKDAKGKYSKKRSCNSAVEAERGLQTIENNLNVFLVETVMTINTHTSNMVLT